MSKNNKIVKIGVKLTTGSVKAQIKGLISDFGNLEGKVESVNAVLKLLGDQKNVIKALTTQMQEFSKTNFKPLISDFKTANAETNKLSKSLTTMDSKAVKANKTVLKLGGSLGTFGEEAKSLANNLGKALEISQLKALSRGLNFGIAISVSGAQAALDEFSTVQDKLTQAAGVASGSARGFDKAYSQIEEAVTRTARTTRFEAQDTADAFLEFAKAGIVASDAIEALPEALALASAAQISASKAASISKDILKSYGKEVSDLNEINNVLVGTTTASNTTITSLSTAMLAAAPAARRVGLDINDVAAFMGVMGDAAIKSGKAGTGLRQILSRFNKPSKAVKESLAAIGVSTDSIKTGGLRELVIGINKAKAAAKDTKGFDELFDRAFGVRAGEKVAAFQNITVDAFDKIKEAQKDAVKENFVSFLETKNIQTFGGQMDILGSKIKALAKTVGESLAPMAIEVAKLFSRMLDFASGLDEDTVDFFVKLGVAATVAAASISALASIRVGALGLQILGTALLNTTVAAGTASSAAATMGVAATKMGAILSSVGLVLVTITAAVGLVVTIFLALEHAINRVSKALGSDFTINLVPIQQAIDLATDKSFSLIDGLASLGTSFMGVSNDVGEMQLSLRSTNEEMLESTKAYGEAKDELNDFNKANKAFLDKNKKAVPVMTRINDLMRLGTSRTADQNSELTNQIDILDSIIGNKRRFNSELERQFKLQTKVNQADLRSTSNKGSDTRAQGESATLEARSQLSSFENIVFNSNLEGKGLKNGEVDTKALFNALNKDRNNGNNEEFTRFLAPLNVAMNKGKGAVEELAASLKKQIVGMKIVRDAQSKMKDATTELAASFKTANDANKATAPVKETTPEKIKAKSSKSRRGRNLEKIRNAISALEQTGVTLDKNLVSWQAIDVAMKEGASSIKQMMKAARVSRSQSRKLSLSLSKVVTTAVNRGKDTELSQINRNTNASFKDAKDIFEVALSSDIAKNDIQGLDLSAKKERSELEKLTARTISAESDVSRNHASAIADKLAVDISNLINKGELGEAKKVISDIKKTTKGNVNLVNPDKEALKPKIARQEEKVNRAEESFRRKQKDSSDARIEQIVTNFTTTIQLFSGSIANVTDTMLGLANALSGLIGVFGNNALTSLGGDLFSDLSSGLSDATNSAVGGLANVATSLAVKLGTATTATAGAAVATTGAAAATGGAAIPVAAIAGIALAISDLGEFFKSIGDTVNNLVSSLVDFGVALFQQTASFDVIETTMNGFITQMATALDPLGALVLSLVEGPIAELAAVLKSLVGDIGGVMGPVFEQLITTVIDMIPAFRIAGAVITRMIEIFSSSLGGVDIAAIVNTLATGLASVFPILQGLSQLAGSLFDLVKTIFVQIFRQLGAVFGPIMTVMDSFGLGLRSMTENVGFIAGGLWIAAIAISGVAVAFNAIIETLFAIPRVIYNGIDLAVKSLLNKVGLVSDSELAVAKTKFTVDGAIGDIFGGTTAAIEDLVTKFNEGPAEDIMVDTDIDFGSLELAVENGTRKGTTGLLNGPQGFRAALQRFRAKNNQPVGASGFSVGSRATVGQQANLEKSNVINIRNMTVMPRDLKDFKDQMEKAAFENGSSPFNSSPFNRG